MKNQDFNQMRENYIINTIAELYGNHIIVYTYPDYNGGHDTTIDNYDYELKACEYVVAEGSVRKLWEENPILTTHKEPRYEKPIDYRYSFRELCENIIKFYNR